MIYFGQHLKKTSWVKSLFQMKNLFNLPSLDIYRYVQKNNLIQTF
jgi:hypothetical protein